MNSKHAFLIPHDGTAIRVVEWTKEQCKLMKKHKWNSLIKYIVGGNKVEARCGQDDENNYLS